MIFCGFSVLTSIITIILKQVKGKTIIRIGVIYKKNALLPIGKAANFAAVCLFFNAAIYEKKVK